MSAQETVEFEHWGETGVVKEEGWNAKPQREPGW
jgi:hypothetical protein